MKRKKVRRKYFRINIKRMCSNFIYCILYVRLLHEGLKTKYLRFYHEKKKNSYKPISNCLFNDGNTVSLLKRSKSYANSRKSSTGRLGRSTDFFRFTRFVPEGRNTLLDVMSRHVCKKEKTMNYLVSPRWFFLLNQLNDISGL